MFKALKRPLKNRRIRLVMYILIVGSIVAALLAGGIAPLNIGQPPVDFDTESKGYSFGTWEGKGSLNLDQLADSMQYITGNASEKVVAAAQIRKASLSFQCVVDMKYVYRFTTGGSWGEPDRVWHPEQASWGVGWIIIKTDISQFLPASSGFLRTEFWVHLWDYCGTLNTDMGWGIVAQDDAYVRYGGSELKFDQTQYEVGDTAVINYKVGYARSAKTEDPTSSSGWTFALFSYAQNRVVHSETIPGPEPGSGTGFVQGNIYYTIQPADFKSGGCGAGATNKLEATLYNNLVFTRKVAATTVDVKELAPPVPTITLDKDKYWIGDGLTIQLTAEPNGETGLEICGMNLRIYYDDSGVELVDIDLNGAAVEYKYGALPDAGIVKIEAFSWDSGSRPSQIASASIKVLDPEGDEEPINIFWIVLVMVVLAIVSFLIWLPMIPLPVQIKTLITVLVWGVIAGMLIYFIIVPILVNFFQNLFRLP